MTTTLKIDFVSDIACPWCAVGLGALEQALDSLQGEVKADIRFQPFELNPNLAEGGQDLFEHLNGRGRIFNTFDAHRLLYWAEVTADASTQHRLKKAFFEAYQGRGENIESHAVLLAAVNSLGLDGAAAQTVLESDTYAQEVKEREHFYTNAGISAVPAVIINDRHLISGGQPAHVFAQALRDIAAQA